jgi:acyl carrier protein
MSDRWIPLASIPDHEIQARLASIAAGSLRIDAGRITAETSMVDLGAESIDIVEITLDTEHAFTVLMPERNVLDLATEVAGEACFESEGVLTELGSELLRSRMPHVDPAALAPGAPVKDLAPLFLRIDVWVRLVHGLLEATPRTCPRCAGRLVQGPPTQVRCPPCAEEIALPTGDAVVREWVRRWLANHRT